MLLRRVDGDSPYYVCVVSAGEMYVLAAEWDEGAGGAFFDQIIADDLVAQWNAKYPDADIRQNPRYVV